MGSRGVAGLVVVALVACTPTTVGPCTPNPCTATNRTVCRAAEPSVACDCDRGFVPGVDGCQEPPAWTCGEPHDGDEGEPDECPGFATLLEPGVRLSRSLSPAGDQDWYRVTGRAGQVWAVVVTAAAPVAGGLHLDSYRPLTFEPLAQDHAGGPAALVRFGLRAHGEVFVRVKATRQSEQAEYVIELQPQAGDDYPDEPTGEMLSLPMRVSGAVQHAGDVDVIGVRVPAGVAVGLQGETSRLAIDLVDEAGVVRRELGRERLVFSVPTPQVVWLRTRLVLDYEEGTFDLSAAVLRADDHSDEESFATPIPVDGTPVTLRQDDEVDTDFLSFPVQQGRGYLVQTHGPASHGPTITISGRVEWPLAGASTTLRAEASGVGTIAVYRAGYREPGQTTVSVLELELDDHGDDAATATPLTVDVPLNGVLELATDRDVFSFTLPIGHIAEVTATDVQNRPITVRLSKGSDLTISFSQTNVAAGVVTDSTTHLATLWADGPRSYEVLLVDRGVDDHGAAPTALTAGTTVSGAIQYAGDVDVFSFTATAGHVYSLDLRPLASSRPYAVELTPPAGVATPLVYISPARFLTPLAGEWTLRVAMELGGVGAYELMLVDTGPEDHGATVAQATPLALGVDGAGSLDFLGDVDVFAVPVTAGTVYSARCTPQGSFSCTVRRLDAAGVLLASREAELPFLATATGTAWVAVASGIWPNPLVRGYLLNVQATGADEHGDTNATATPVQLGAVVAGTTQYEGDPDVLALPVATGQQVELQLVGPPTSCTLEPRRPGGTLLPSTLLAPATESLFITVRCGALASWTLTIVDRGLDDWPDDVALAPRLGLDGGTLSGNVIAVGDHDLVLVPAAAGELVRVDCTTTTGLCTLSGDSPSGSAIAGAASAAGVATFSFRAAVAGDYRVRVTRSTLSAPGTELQWRLSGRAVTDDHGDTQATRTLAPGDAGVVITGRVDYAADVDVIAVPLAANQRLVLETDDFASFTIAVRDPQGQYQYTLTGYPQTVTATMAGTWSFEVGASQFLGPYRLRPQ